MSRLLVYLLLAGAALAQTPPPPLPPPNPLLENHKKWFLPAEVWDIQTDPRLAAHRPKGLTYKAYSAVGYNLANTIAVVGPTGEITIIDTLGDRKSVATAIRAFRDQKIFPAEGKQRQGGHAAVGGSDPGTVVSEPLQPARHELPQSRHVVPQRRQAAPVRLVVHAPQPRHAALRQRQRAEAAHQLP
jgi:hypothetical protein